MARLNEPSAQVESVEALKRRFVRQNREIARVNSTQSIRIRTLESDVSRLLTENIALREQVIKLQFEIDNNVGLGNISTVKGRLEAKLLELGGLVQELGNVQKSAEDRRALRRRSGAKDSPKPSPDQRNWKNALTISEAAGGVDGRLPPIVEGKYYPRRTLDADELGGLLSTSGDSAESPDLGPPPVAHFDTGDPIEFNANQNEAQVNPSREKEDGLNPARFANLETRRRRRESWQPGVYATPVQADLQASQEEDGADNQLKSGYALKTGAKRKFMAKEDEEQVDRVTAPEGDDIQPDLNPTTARSHGANQTTMVTCQTESEAAQTTLEVPVKNRDGSREKSKVITSSALTGRSVLAPKSVNTDPVLSPVKSRRPAEGEKAIRSVKDVSSKSRERNRSKEKLPSERFARPLKAAEAAALEPKALSHNDPPPSKPPPEIPAPPPPDFFSPDGYEPPVARPESRDTPPPGDLDPETANTSSFGSIGRSSRRQRGNVSYAEPNLRDKMRRPTKELVDAVAAEERLQQGKNLKPGVGQEGTEPFIVEEAPSKLRTVTVKKEPTDDDIPDWKSVPAKGLESERDSMRVEAPSPLGNKVPAVKANLPASVVTERRRRPSIPDRERQINQKGQQASGAGTAIAALMTDNLKAKPGDNNTRAAESNKVSRSAEDPDIYKVSESSATEADNPAVKAKEGKPAMTRTSRRHSSISDDRVKDALARRAERRKEGASDGRPSSRTGGVPDLKNARSSVGLGVESGEGPPGRGERAASRRRSMML
ncbi:MAG: hypothetical protein Q9209_000031 [Squamulea sp. 1 TL-2023]